MKKQINFLKASGNNQKLEKGLQLPNLDKHKKNMERQLGLKEKHEAKLSLQQLNRPKEFMSIEQMATQAMVKGKDYEEEEKFEIVEKDLNKNAQQQSKKAFIGELKKVIELADVLLEVLDARDPMGCRSKQIEDEVRSSGKKLVFVLNKIDLVPSAGNVRMW